MGMCADDGALSCGTNGHCNGAGNCQVYPVGTACGQTCVGTSYTHWFCDGAGMCSVTDKLKCAPDMCTLAGCVPGSRGSATAPQSVQQPRRRSVHQAEDPMHPRRACELALRSAFLLVVAGTCSVEESSSSVTLAPSPVVGPGSSAFPDFPSAVKFSGTVSCSGAVVGPNHILLAGSVRRTRMRRTVRVRSPTASNNCCRR